MNEQGAGNPAGAVVVMTTIDAPEAADRLAAGLVEARLAACVQIVPVTSHYRWQESLERAAECLLLVKTTVGRSGDVQNWLAAHHPYEIPEILVAPVTGGSPAYLSWLGTESADPDAESPGPDRP